MAENKITEDQLNKIHDFQKEIRTFLIEVGAKEAEKHALLHRLVGVNEKQEEPKGPIPDAAILSDHVFGLL